MTKRSGMGMRLYIGGYDLSGDVGSIGSVSAPVGVFEVTGIDKLGIERIQGLRDGQITFNVFFNDAAGQAHPVLKAFPSTDVFVMVLLSTTAGDEVVHLVAKQVDYALTAALTGA